MRKEGKKRAGLILALIVFFVAAACLFYYIGMPKIADYKEKKEQQGMSVLDKYYENTDMAGWIQVEGTDISYPVMKGDIYLYRDFEKEHSPSGTPFVEDYWEEDSPVSLIYGHNMWMYKTMFNPLHKFKDEDFFEKHKIIKFYAVCGSEEKYVEKRTYEITHVILTEVDSWNYASCGLIEDAPEIDSFKEECDRRALHKRNTGESRNLIVLSTCSYHVKGRGGRLAVAGELKEKTVQECLDE